MPTNSEYQKLYSEGRCLRQGWKRQEVPPQDAGKEAATQHKCPPVCVASSSDEQLQHLKETMLSMMKEESGKMIGMLASLRQELLQHKLEEQGGKLSDTNIGSLNGQMLSQQLEEKIEKVSGVSTSSHGKGLSESWSSDSSKQ